MMRYLPSLPVKSFRLLWIAAALSFLAGCAQVQLPPPSAKLEIVEKVRASKLPSMAVGSFKLDPKANADIDRGVSVRSNKFSSPFEGSFAQYLRETLLADLRAAGLFDPASSLVVSGTLTDSTLDVPMDIGRATLAARFTLSRSNQIAYDKELKANATWPSSFIGMTAIPEGVRQYTDLYHKLVQQLLDDPDFQNALRR